MKEKGKEGKMKNEGRVNTNTGRGEGKQAGREGGREGEA